MQQAVWLQLQYKIKSLKWQPTKYFQAYSHLPSHALRFSLRGTSSGSAGVRHKEPSQRLCVVSNLEF